MDGNIFFSNGEFSENHWGTLFSGNLEKGIHGEYSPSLFHLTCTVPYNDDAKLLHNPLTIKRQKVKYLMWPS